MVLNLSFIFQVFNTFVKNFLSDEYLGIYLIMKLCKQIDNSSLGMLDILIKPLS